MNEFLHPQWHGKSVVVTGGSGGLGAAVTAQLLEAGATVHVVDARTPEELAWGHLPAAQRGRVHTWHFDVTDEQAWAALASALDERGLPLHGLVNNAGITGPRHTVTQVARQDWDRVMSVNVTGAMLGIRALATLMPYGASIVNVASTVGMTGYHSAAYSTSKWALRGLTRSAALELAGRGIRVNSVCPGVVDTDMVRGQPALMAALRTVIPMRQMATAHRIADAVMFLLGPQSSYVTATDIAVDGGITGAGLYGQVAQAIGAI